jgi:hypothetical protein
LAFDHPYGVTIAVQDKTGAGKRDFIGAPSLDAPEFVIGEGIKNAIDVQTIKAMGSWRGLGRVGGRNGERGIKIENGSLQWETRAAISGTTRSDWGPGKGSSQSSPSKSWKSSSIRLNFLTGNG